MLAPRIADKAPRPATSRPRWAPAPPAGLRPSVLVRQTAAMRSLWRRLTPRGLRVLSRIRPEPESAPGLSFETNFEGRATFSGTSAYAARVAWGVGVAVLLWSWQSTRGVEKLPMSQTERLASQNSQPRR